MALKKVVSLKNIGRFKNLVARGDVQLKRLTLIYGLNGHGKTTLTGVLRSLATGDRAYIDERVTLGATEQPSCEILLDEGEARYSKGAWSRTAANLEIFDSTFVNENVFTGEHVSSEHRKNLYEVMVGAAAVSLAREVDRLDAEGRKAASEISDAEGALTAVIQAPFQLKAFLDLAPIDDVTVQVQNVTAQLSAVRKQREVLTRSQIGMLAKPLLPDGIVRVLARSVEQISAETEERVRTHVRRLGHQSEGWIRQGLQYLKDDHECPFCGQDISAVDLIALFRSFFSTAYRDHLVEVERGVNELQRVLGDDVLAGFHRQVLSNHAVIQRWADLADLNSAAYEASRLDSVWKRAREILEDSLRRKLANPSEPVEVSTELRAALEDFEDAVHGIARHNETIGEANLRIAELKRQSAATSAESLEQELRRLRNTEIRHSVDTTALVARLVAAREQKKNHEDAKKQKKEELGTVASAVLAKYQVAINRLLQSFGANFTIANTKPSFAGGKASSTYQIELNSIALNIGDPSTPRGTPCFRTALSTGDKSTLALAFFLARLEQEDISGRCVVIDDPLSSLDSFRCACTQQELAQVAKRAAQTVILSHDAFFLKGVWDTSEASSSTCLQVVRDSGSHVLRPWDVSKYFLREAHSEYFLMSSYLQDGPPEHGDLTGVARAIRPYLEGHLRHRYPAEFGPTEWLGDFIMKVRSALPGGPLEGCKSKLSELEALNEYSRGFHHTSTAAPPRPTDADLPPWVRRAIAFVQS